MLNLYTYTDYLSQENRSHVFPLLFDLFYLKSKEVLGDFHMTEKVETSDVIIVPVSVNRLYQTKKTALIDELMALGRKHHKPVWIYSAGDYGISMSEEMVNFRLSGFDSKMSHMNEIMPSFINDPYVRFDDNFSTLEKQDIPKIGFVGQAVNSWENRLKYQINWAIKNGLRSLRLLKTDAPDRFNAPYERWKILKNLEESKRIKPQFILNKHYRGGVVTPQEKEESEHKYFKNMASCPYTLCIRGAGNFSVRFYETLAMGRIPVYVESDARLPLMDIIEWDKHIVKVDPHTIAEQLNDFHRRIAKDDFLKIQKNNRNLWLKCLRRPGYFKLISKQLNIG